jgi:hypothetical protein
MFLKGTTIAGMRLWMQFAGKLTVRDLNKVTDATLVNDAKLIKNNANLRPGNNKDKPITLEDLVTWHGAKPFPLTNLSVHDKAIVDQVSPTLTEYTGHRRLYELMSTVITDNKFGAGGFGSWKRCSFIVNELALHESLVLNERVYTNYGITDRYKIMLPKYRDKILKTFPLYSYTRPKSKKNLTIGFVTYQEIGAMRLNVTKIRIHEVQSSFQPRPDFEKMRHLNEFDSIPGISMKQVSQILLTDFIRTFANNGFFEFELSSTVSHKQPAYEYTVLPKKEGFAPNGPDNFWSLVLQ